MLLEVRGLGAQAHGFALFAGIDADLGRGGVLRVESDIERARSVFLGCIAGVTAPDAGTVSVDGRAPDGDVVSVLQDAGFPQDISVATHLEEVLGEHAADPVAAAAELLARVGLGHRASHEPWAMSAGEYRRIALELAFTLPKRILVLDEPEQRLDRPSIDWVVDSMRRQRAGGVAVVVATYDDRIAALATRRLDLDRPAQRP